MRNILKKKVTVDSVVAQFTKTIDKLSAMTVSCHDEARSSRQKADDVMEKARAEVAELAIKAGMAEEEADRARRIANNLAKLMGDA